MLIKFKDVFHEGTEDGFEIERAYKTNKRLVRVYQEMDSGLVREFMITEDDLHQMIQEVKKNKTEV
jgi:hypothetical protein